MSRFLELKLEECNSSNFRLRLKLINGISKFSLYTSTFLDVEVCLNLAKEAFCLTDNELLFLKDNKFIKLYNFSIDQKIVTTNLARTTKKILIILNVGNRNINIADVRLEHGSFYFEPYCGKSYKDLNNFFNIKIGEDLNEELCDELAANYMIEKMIN